MFIYPDDSEILETWISISSFKYFRVIRIEKQILPGFFLGEVTARQFCFEIYWPLGGQLDLLVLIFDYWETCLTLCRLNCSSLSLKLFMKKSINLSSFRPLIKNWTIQLSGPTRITYTVNNYRHKTIEAYCKYRWNSNYLVIHQSLTENPLTHMVNLPIVGNLHIGTKGFPIVAK